MIDFEALAKGGVEIRRFCSFGRIDDNCTEEVIGDIGVQLNEEVAMLPICDKHYKQVTE